jgi:DNA-binding MarR family transcriptional regulator
MDLSSTELDVAILSSLVGTALDARTLDALRVAGHPHLRRVHGFVFQHLIEKQPTVSQLASALGVTQQAASKSVAELETLGYLRRETDARDSRVRRIALTERGREAIAVSRQVRVDLSRALLDDVGRDALDTTRQVLVALLDKLDATAAISTRSVPLPAE